MAFYPCKPSESKSPASQTGALYRCWLGGSSEKATYLIQFQIDQTARSLDLYLGPATRLSQFFVDTAATSLTIVGG